MSSIPGCLTIAMGFCEHDTHCSRPEHMQLIAYTKMMFGIARVSLVTTLSLSPYGFYLIPSYNINDRCKSPNEGQPIVTTKCPNEAG